MPNEHISKRGRSLGSEQARAIANRRRHIAAIRDKLQKLTPEERQELLKEFQDKKTEQ